MLAAAERAHAASHRPRGRQCPRPAWPLPDRGKASRKALRAKQGWRPAAGRRNASDADKAEPREWPRGGGGGSSHASRAHVRKRRPRGRSSVRRRWPPESRLARVDASQCLPSSQSLGTHPARRISACQQLNFTIRRECPNAASGAQLAEAPNSQQAFAGLRWRTGIVHAAGIRHRRRSQPVMAATAPNPSEPAISRYQDAINFQASLELPCDIDHSPCSRASPRPKWDA